MLENVLEKVNLKEFVKEAILCLIMAGILAITAQISIPLPGGVPMTLQTFSIALIGFMLTRGKAVKTILTYLFLGVIGVPVFASGNFGFATLFGLTGGFLIGFIALVIFCNKAKNVEKVSSKILLSVVALASLHLLGILQYSIITGMGITNAFMLVSLPFLFKDSLSILLALLVSEKLHIKHK